MEDVQVELNSKELIKPSSPTPDHLRHYQLSFLDQLSPKVYNPWLLFYTLNRDDHDHHREFNNIVTISNHLKKSLSQVLSLYYPLAGRAKDDRFVDCNDEGVPFFEARVSGLKLSDVMENPNINELNKFLPFKLDEVTELALGIQLNVFECGGIAIGVCNSHQLSDALSNIAFVKTWVTMARGETDAARPEFISAALFPPRNLAAAGVINPNIGITRKNNITKRFVFKASAIEAIRAKCDENLVREDWRCPSRVEALSAFLWSRFVDATNEHDQQKPYTVVHAVNLRPRFDPPLGQNHFGNFFRISMTVPTFQTGEESCHGFVRQVREEIGKIDKEFVRKLQEGGGEHFELLQDRIERVVRGEMFTLAFTSLCRFPVYEADFGWGKPAWVGSAALNFHNVIAFIDTKTGEGIEAYLSLKEEDMAKLEVDNEFQAFVNFSD